MHIVYFCNAINTSGGLDRIVIAKANYLSETHTVFIVTSNQKDKNYFYDLNTNVIHIDFSEYGKTRTIWFERDKFKKIMRTIKPNIIVAVTGKESLCLPFFDSKTPKIKEMHFSKYHRIIQHKNTHYLKKIALYLLNHIEERVYSLYDRVTPLTYEDQKEWNLKNLEVIYNFPSFKSVEKASLIKKKIITVGRLDYQKGFDLLLYAWQMVCQTNSEWELIVYGEGKLKEELIALSKNLNIDDRVVFAGNTNNIQQAYLNSSIYIMSSRHEGFGLVLVEAMECGLPIVSFDCPCGPNDIITDSIDGILVENGNVELLASKLVSLIENPEEQARLAKNAIEKAKQFDIEIIMKQWESLFSRVDKGTR